MEVAPAWYLRRSGCSKPTLPGAAAFFRATTHASTRTLSLQSAIWHTKGQEIASATAQQSNVGAKPMHSSARNDSCMHRIMQTQKHLAYETAHLHSQESCCNAIRCTMSKWLGYPGMHHAMIAIINSRYGCFISNTRECVSQETL